MLGTKRQFLRYACIETSHLQKQTPYFQYVTSLELNVFYQSSQRNILLIQTLDNLFGNNKKDK